MVTEKQRYAIEAGALSALLIAATLMRTTRIGRGFWEDEAVEYVLGAARPFWGSFTYQPFPLYHVFAHIALYFSDAEWVIRIPSLLAGIAGIGVLYLVTRRYFGVAAAIVAAILLTVSTFHISSSTEARFYALTMLASVLVLWTLHTALLRDTRRDWIAYVVAGNVAAMSQLMMLPLLGSMAGAAVVWTAIENRRSGAPLLTPRMRNLLIASALTLAGVAVAVLSSGYNLARFVATDSTSAAETVILDDLGNPLESVQTRRLAPSQYWFYLRFYLEEPAGLPAVLLAAFGLVGLAALARRHAPAAAMIAAAIVVPPLPFLVITVTHFYHPRYFCGVLPFLLLIVAGGVAVTAMGARRAAQRLLDRYGERSSQRSRNAALHAAAALPFIVFAAQMGPVSARAVDALYNEDFTRGLHYEFAHDITTAYLLEQAAATDMAAMCFPRPDWRYYYRKNLADHLIEPVRPNEPFTLWYVGGMANCVNVSDFPTGARFVRMIREDWLEKRTIFLFEVTAPHIRTILGTGEFGRVDDPGIGVQRHIEDLPVVDSGAPLRFEVRDHGETARFATAPVPALPHRYVEFLLTATGPPQYGLALDYYDTTGRFLHREVFRMRDAQTQREPHLTGDTPPMAPADGSFTIKLADVSPPLAAFVHAELLIEGDTRRGDVYDVQSIEVRANWRDEAQGVDLDLPPFTTDRGTVEDWTVLAERSPGERPIEVTRSGEMTITAAGGPAQFRIESRMFPIREWGSLQLEVPFTGNPDLISPSAVFFDARGERLERVQLTAQPVYEWWSTRNMLVAPADADGWARLLATIRVPWGAARVQVTFDANPDALEAGAETGDTLVLRSPRLLGFE